MTTTHHLTEREHGKSQAERVQQRASVPPRVDVYENAEELLVLADVPGATKDTIRIELDRGQLTIEARRDPAAHGAKLATEHRPFDYHRIFTVPQGIDASKIDAELAAGVLRLRLPKSEALRPRTIDIKAS